jgi:transcriptional regulator with XRE-family HTH domain
MRLKKGIVHFNDRHYNAHFTGELPLVSFIDRHVGRAVRDRREALAMSQDDLAARLCIPTEALRRQEDGELRVSLAELHDLGKALGVGVGYFFQSVLELMERTPAVLRLSDLVPPGSEKPDAAFLLAFLQVLHRMAGAEGLGRVEYYLECASQEIRRCIRQPNG